jgi:hypothetical protein
MKLISFREYAYIVRNKLKVIDNKQKLVNKIAARTKRI